MLCRRVSANDDRTKKVTSGNSTVSYDYAGTRLNKILFGTGENSESYSFTYDSFGNVLSTKVGSTALSQSTYGANNGLLQKYFGNAAGSAFFRKKGDRRKAAVEDSFTAQAVYNLCESTL